jgi:hypothetical protein
MSLEVWVLLFAATVLFWAWVIFWGGADWLEESVFSILLFGYDTEYASARFIRFYAWLSLLGTGIWFVVGLVNPQARFWY